MTAAFIHKENMESKKDVKNYDELEVQLKFAEMMNNTPKSIQLGDKVYQITALKPGTQWLIAEESCKIAKAEQTFTDLIKQYAVNKPSVARCITLAILNNKNDIFGERYNELYEEIFWETDSKDWIKVLVTILGMLEFDRFFLLTESVQTFREMTMTKKITGVKQSTPKPNGAK